MVATLVNSSSKTFLYVCICQKNDSQVICARTEIYAASAIDINLRVRCPFHGVDGGRQGNEPTLFGTTLQPTDQPTDTTEKVCNGMIRSLVSVKSV